MAINTSRIISQIAVYLIASLGKHNPLNNTLDSTTYVRHIQQIFVRQGVYIPGQYELADKILIYIIIPDSCYGKELAGM